MSFLDTLRNLIGRGGQRPEQRLLPGETVPGGREQGTRATPEAALQYLYRRMQVDFEYRATVLEIRRMDRIDGRVKKIHGRMARAATNGGLILLWEDKENQRVIDLWHAFRERLHLQQPQKLESDARGLVMEGNLPIQWVLDSANRVSAGVRMPADTLSPQVAQNGRFADPARAYVQWDLTNGRQVAEFPLWALTLGRLTPDNFDDQGALGRPYLDANRATWRKLNMTEEDLVIRRRQRAPLRRSHILENATKEELQQYQAQIEHADQQAIVTDYYSNRKGSVTTLQGDANLDQIADVSYLLDTFFSGAPAPKGLFGYAGDLSRDILEDMKKDFYDELDALQDTLAAVYQLGFRLDLLLAGLNPDQYQFRVAFKERMTESANQAADRALKQQAMGASQHTVWETAGLDPERELARIKRERKARDPYPDPGNIRPAQRPPARVTVIPGNQTKGESQTTVGGS